jgi:hypothetical protein
VYLQLLLGWGEHGLPGAVCATVALSHIAAAAAIRSPSSVTNLGDSALPERNSSKHHVKQVLT